ncbi:MAG: HesA/MoeB/ThiF family protein [Acidobacteriota bacterium]
MGHLTEVQRERYSRQLVLPQVGLAGQERLARSSVAVVGAGGLGSPVLLYLAAAGVGRLVIADGDQLELSNLQRQVIYTASELGRMKADCAAAAVRRLNPEVEVGVIGTRVGGETAVELLCQVDVVCDCTDSFASRVALHEAAFTARRPLVSAAMFGFEGQLTTFRGFEEGMPCYRCLYPELPPPDLVPPCAEAGVMGAAVGVLGSLQAGEVLKELLGIGHRLGGRLLVVDTLENEFRLVSIAKDPDCPCCAPRR